MLKATMFIDVREIIPSLPNRAIEEAHSRCNDIHTMQKTTLVLNMPLQCLQGLGRRFQKKVRPPAEKVSNQW
jgi:hypothetical protein